MNIWSSSPRTSTSEYESASRLMIVFSVVGVVVGLLFGFLIGQYGVSKPIRMIVSLLQSLAEGRFDMDISGTERKDEIGDVAKTALVFKENGIAKIRMEAEQKENEQRAVVQRKQDMIKLADTSKAPSARSSKPCRRPRPNSKPPPPR